MSEIEFTGLDTGNRADVDQWMELSDRAVSHDLPDFPLSSRAPRWVGLTRTSKNRRTEHVVAKVGGQIVASAELMFPLADNLHMIDFELEVDPAHRRKGIGTALLAEVERRALADNRTTLIIYVPEQLPGRPELPDGGKQFALKTGYTAGLDEIHRRADLSIADDGQLDELLAKAWQRAEGYEVVQWINRAPDDLVDNVAYLDGRLLTDAPLGDLDMEPQNVDAARIRESEEGRRAAGQLDLNTAVRHVASGKLAGWTDIVVNPGDETDSWQGITLVDPDHRGHRIGTILKIENHRYLRRYRPLMRYVHTWNAEENAFMININEAVGYRAMERWIAMQKKLTA